MSIVFTLCLVINNRYIFFKAFRIDYSFFLNNEFENKNIILQREKTVFEKITFCYFIIKANSGYFFLA